jgi:F-type H+-transporting ATPase subunit epsilon
MAKLFNLEIMTPDRQFFSGEIESLIVDTPHGELGILYNSLPIVAILRTGIIKILQNDKWLEAANGEGFLEITSSSRVLIMTSFAEWGYEISLAEAEKELSTAEQFLRKQSSVKEYKMAKAQLARQFARLRLKNRGMD